MWGSVCHRCGGCDWGKECGNGMYEAVEHSEGQVGMDVAVDLV